MFQGEIYLYLYSFLSEFESTPGPEWRRNDYVNDTNGNPNLDLPDISAMP
jgi:hypothetical protein